MTTFTRSIALPVRAEQAFDWHERPGAFARLTPPWENVQLVEHHGGIKDGAKVVVRIQPLPGVTFHAVYRHADYKYGEQFVDLQERGPFKTWRYEHRFHADGDQCVLEDHIEFEGPPMSNRLVLRRLDRMFRYRHAMTVADLAYESRFGFVRPQTVLVSGASGLVGQALVARLTTRGHQIKKLGRHPTTDSITWNPTEGKMPADALENVDAIIHLAGESIAQRWRPKIKERILRSRVDGAQLLVDAALELGQSINYISASGINIYANNGKMLSDEMSPHGDGFLADVWKVWEGAASPLQDAGMPVTMMRTGVVMSQKGGALKKMLPAFKSGVAGRIGSGKQHMSWIAIDDLVDQYLLALEQPTFRGTINNVAPEPVSNEAFTQTMGQILQRPTLLPAPAQAIKWLFGEMAEETVLADLPVAPARLQTEAYPWRQAKLTDCLRHELGV